MQRPAEELAWFQMLRERAALVGTLALAAPVGAVWPDLCQLSWRNFGQAGVFALISMLLAIGFEKELRRQLVAKGLPLFRASLRHAWQFWAVVGLGFIGATASLLFR